MKHKIYVLFILLALTSCNTQADVAVPTSTPIPTETPAPPTQISTPTEIPTSTEPPIESTEAGAAAITLLNEIKVDLTTVKLTINPDGVVVGTEIATGNKILSDGMLDVFFLREALINSGNLMPTKFEPSKGNVLPGTPTDLTRTEYLFGVLADKFVDTGKEMYGFDPTRDESGKLRNGVAFLLDPNVNAWGFVKDVDFGNGAEKVLVFQKNDGSVDYVRLMMVSRDEISYFWRNATPTP